MSNPYDNAKDGHASVLGPTLKFKGALKADEDLLILGNIEGSIKHSSNLTIGESGQIKADVSAENIAIEGTVRGDLRGSKCVKVRETANVSGNIVSPNVSLVEGSTFNGKIDMDSDPTAAVANPPESQSADNRQQAANKSARPNKKSADAA